MIRLLKIGLIFLIGSLIYGLWLSLPSGNKEEDIIDLSEDGEGKFGVG